MKAEVTAESRNRLRDKLVRLTREQKTAAEDAMTDALALVETSAVNNVNKSPPEHLQVQTGRGMGSIMSEQEWHGDILEGRTGTNVGYMAVWEFGYMRGYGYGGAKTVEAGGRSYKASGMVGPYSWLAPALHENEDEIRQLFRDATMRVVKSVEE